jgi:hypothetical protein
MNVESVRARSLGNVCATGLTWVLFGLALLLCFRGYGYHFWWVLLALSVPALRYLLSGEFRDTCRGLLADSGAELEAFAARPEAIPWRGIFVCAVLPFALLFLGNTHTQVADNLPVFLAAGHLVQKGTPECSDYLLASEWSFLTDDNSGLNYCLVRVPAGVYSSYPSGPLQAAVPVALLARLAGADFDRPKVHEHLQKFTAAWLSAACLGCFLLVALHLVPAAPAYFATLLLATGSTMFTTIGMGIWQHGGIIFWSLVFLLAELRQARAVSSKWTLLQGLALGWMLPWRPSALLVAGPLGLWLLARHPRRALLVGLVAGLAFLPWGWFYWTHYRSLLGPTSGQARYDNWSWSSPDRYLSVLFSPGRGLFVYQPWLIVLLLWLWPGRRVKRQAPEIGFPCRSLLIACAVAVILNVIVVSAWSCWWGGWCYGSRLCSEVIPLAGLLCLKPIAYLWESSAGRKTLATLLAVSFLIHAGCAYAGAEGWNGDPRDVDEHPERLARWDDPPFLFPILKHVPSRR